MILESLVSQLLNADTKLLDGLTALLHMVMKIKATQLFYICRLEVFFQSS